MGDSNKVAIIVEKYTEEGDKPSWMLDLQEVGATYCRSQMPWLFDNEDKVYLYGSTYKPPSFDGLIELMYYQKR